MEKFDSVTRPAHYAEGRKYEPKDVIRDWDLNFNLGSAVKYISRAGRKDDILQDLHKAKQFLEFEIDALENESNKEPTQKPIGTTFTFDFEESEDYDGKNSKYNSLYISAQAKWVKILVESNGKCTLDCILKLLGFNTVDEEPYIKEALVYGYERGDEVSIYYDKNTHKVLVQNLRKLV